MKQKNAVFLGAVLVVLLGVLELLQPTSATATDANGNRIDDQFESSGWWNVRAANATDTSSSTKKNLYNQWPLACNNNPADRAFEVYYVTSAYGDEVSVMSTASASVRSTIRGAASAIAASSQSVITDTASYQTSRAPRFVTNPGTGTICDPKITEVTAPESYFRNAVDSRGTNLVGYVRNTYNLNNPARKYIIMAQDSDNTYARAYASFSYNGYYPNPNNQLNGLAFIYLPVNAVGLQNNNANPFSNEAWKLAHEMTHTLGAMLTEQPHYNYENNGSGHPTDCNDILCYGPGTAGQVWDGSCGTEDSLATARKTFRLDCNNDDYFNINSPAWETQRWNAYRHSAFLWGNPQPTGGPADCVCRRTPGPKTIRVTTFD